MSSLIMGRDETIKLIQQYGSHRHLWDVGDPRYFQRPLRMRAWRQIARNMNAPAAELKRRLSSLLGSFRREKSRERRSLLSGSTRVYRSKWFGYEHFHFLSERTTPESHSKVLNKILGCTDASDLIGSSMKTEVVKVEVDTESADEETPEIKMDPAEDATSPSTSPEPQFSQTANKFRKRPRLNPEEAREATIQSFANYIQNELRKYDPRTLAHVKHAIANVLFEADMGRMEDPPYHASSTILPHETNDDSSAAP